VTDQAQTPQDAGGPVGPEVVAACGLSAVPGIGATAMARIRTQFGTYAAALKAGPGKLVANGAHLQLKPDAIAFLSQKPDLAAMGAAAVAAARAVGARIILRGDDRFPQSLYGIENPPALLYSRGSLRPEGRRIAIVGARDCDDYGLELARAFGEGFGAAGVEVVSGGARGVDSAAHAGALWGEGTTVAVLGSGIDVLYPPENVSLFERLTSGGGALISELPPGTPSVRQNFPRRNRIISGLSAAVVVVRAMRESGSLITANHAAAQGRPIFAVPGRTDEALSEGPNQLIRLGAARAATCAEDVLVALGWSAASAAIPQAPRVPPSSQHAHQPAPQPAAREETTSELLLDAEQIRLFNLLDEHRPTHLDDLAVRAGLSANVALVKLSQLELRGLVLHRPGKYFLRRPT
jgi:DNA processing protein